ncbi:WXG100 family type VII secretion target [Kineosporia sp. J2-2]|uniref:WXG100 family type VII secretion target n=1 Tax=Kineosporia corallincola TaxID=2835133 RepID=A0ABS5TCC0_9ACTN|nr:WXG100 family type VII secretion target [Kineosporia corallincola]MBT0768681.1 WXG100 family type VII secretion target [Kineosporia corallincola]
MSVPWGQLKTWKEEPLENGFREARRIEDELQRVEEALPNASPATWDGTAGQAARQAAEVLTKTLAEHIDSVASLRKALADAADEMAGVVRAVGDAEDYASRKGLSIAHSGTVSDAVTPPTVFGDPADAGVYARERQDYVDEGVRLVEAALTKGQTLDDHLTDGLGPLISYWNTYSPLTGLAKKAGKVSMAVVLARYGLAPSSAVPERAQYLQALSKYQALKGASPDLSDPKVLKQYTKLEKDALKLYKKGAGLPLDVRQSQLDAKRAQLLYKSLRKLKGDGPAMKELLKTFPKLSEADVLGKVGKLDKLTKPFRKVTPVMAKVAGPVAVVSGGADIYSAITDTESATDDRVARGIGGGASIISGGAATALAFGLASGPALPVVVVGAGLVAAGAWAYENREAIGHALSTGADAVGDAAVVVGDSAKKLWKGMFG